MCEIIRSRSSFESSVNLAIVPVLGRVSKRMFYEMIPLEEVDDT
jgi:hypothetical protein